MPALFNSRSGSPGRSLAYLMPWFPGLAAILAAKYTVVTAPAGLGRVIGVRNLGSSALASAALMDRPGLFRADLLVAALVIPALLYLAARRLRPWLVLLLASLMSAAAIVTMLPELLAYRFVGRFLPLDFVYDAVHRGLGNYKDFRAYVGFVRLGLFAAILMSIPALAVAAGFRLRRADEDNAGWLDRTNAGIWSCIGLLTVAAMAAPAPIRPYSQPVVWMVWEALASPVTISASAARFKSEPEEQLSKAFRELTHTPLSRPGGSAYHARAAGYDVVLFILETCFTRCLDLDGPLEEFPALRRVRDHSWVSSRHLSTFPYTNRAMFAILTGQYAPEQLNHLFLSAETKIESLVTAAGSAHYKTGLYMPEEELFFYEKQMYRAMGFDTVVRAENVRQNNAEWTWESVTGRDRKAFQAMQADMQGWTAGGKRHLTIFLPQVGHEPWLHEPGTRQGSQLDDCRAVVGHQDRLLAQLMEGLERSGRANKTLVLVAGDHGARKRENFSDYQSAVLDYQFHVPFLLYAPGVLDRTERIGHVTSHIDVSPSILELLGIDGYRRFEQGSPLWAPDLRQRTTLMFANAMFGFDAFYREGRFHLWDRTHDRVHVSNDMSAGGHEDIADSDPRAIEVRRVITDAVDLQSVRLQRGNAVGTGPRAR